MRTEQVEVVEKTEQKTNISALAIGGKFSKFGPEEEKSSRKAEVKKTEAVRHMKAAWRAYKWDYGGRESGNFDNIVQIIKNLQYCAKDVEEFSIVLGGSQDEDKFLEKAGLFLSALINCGKDEEYLIHTKHLDILPNTIGYFNEKNITVNGDVGDYFGRWMEGGSITINGDAGDLVGLNMKGGHIAVNENAGRGVGLWMKGGSITVGGNAEKWVGWKMKSGSITVEGDAEDMVGLNMEGGSISVEGDAGDNVGEGMSGGSITVQGNAGFIVGWEMRGGTIIINGNVGYSAGGLMEGGNIAVAGDAVDSVGWKMKGGSVTVKGNAGDGVGIEMKGGEIHIKGDYEGISESFEGGKIFYRGKLIKAS
jgi:formylmethanofuran dehydrogenase subunit C